MKKRNLTVLAVAALSISAVGAIALSTSELGLRPMTAQDQVQRDLVGYATVEDTLLNLHDDGLTLPIVFNETSFELNGDIQRIKKIEFTFKGAENTFTYRGLHKGNIWSKLYTSVGPVGTFKAGEEPHRIKATASGNAKFASVEITYDCINGSETNHTELPKNGDAGLYWIRDNEIFNSEAATYCNSLDSALVNFYFDAVLGENYKFYKNDGTALSINVDGGVVQDFPTPMTNRFLFQYDGTKLVLLPYQPTFYIDMNPIAAEWDAKHVTKFDLVYLGPGDEYVSVTGTPHPTQERFYVFDGPDITDIIYDSFTLEAYNAQNELVFDGHSTKFSWTNHYRGREINLNTISLGQNPFYTE